MLEFAAVGNRGRESSVRLTVFAALWTTVALLAAQAPPAFDDLLPELAARVAAILPPGSSYSVSMMTSVSQPYDEAAVRAGLVSLLSARGFRLADDAKPALRLVCLQNLRERVCTAEVRTGVVPTIVMVGRPLALTSREAEVQLALEMRPLYSQSRRILDAVIVSDRLLILDSSSIALYQMAATGWQRVEVRPLLRTGVWPRDLRGRLSVEGANYVAYLPDVTCRGTVSPLELSCADDRRSWPIGIENSGVEPSRNYFNTPERLSFYSAASLEADAEARWVVANRDGGLTLLDDARRVVGGAAEAGEDVARIVSTCRAGTYVLVALPDQGRDGHDVVRLFQVVRKRLIPASSALVLPGALTALWTMSDAGDVIAVTHDADAGRYAAQQIRVSCGDAASKE